MLFLKGCCFPIGADCLCVETAVLGASNPADAELELLLGFGDDGGGCAVEACHIVPPPPLKACSLVDPPASVVADVETRQASACGSRRGGS